MANKYANLVGTNKIKDEYTKINTGFDRVEADINDVNSRITAVNNRVDTIITTPIDGRTAAQEVVDARAGFSTIGGRMTNIEENIETHKAENVSQQIYATRDISLDGVQIITGLIGIPERIVIRAIITDWAKASISIGSWEKNGFAHSCYSILTTQSGSVISYSALYCDVQVFDDELNYLKGIIQNVTPTQFEILWLNDNTSPSGTVNLQIIVYYHGGN